MNKTAKGNKLQLELKKYLTARGFWIDGKFRPRFPRKPVNNNYSLSVDLFGRYDIMAKHPRLPWLMFWFQVSSVLKFGNERTKLIEGVPLSASMDRIFMVRRRDRHDLEFFKYSFGSKEWIKTKELIS